ncbi:MAG: thermonuclease family protein [Sphingomicrobium sp.]
MDGDTLRCGSIRLRLLGIDAPELPGHCARYRQCAPGDGFESKRSLIDALRNGPVAYSVVTTERYGLVVEA